MKTKNVLGLATLLILGASSIASYAQSFDTWWWDQVRAGNHGSYNNWRVPALPSASYPDQKGFPNSYYPYYGAPDKCGQYGELSQQTPDHFGGSADFSNACNNHDICYMTLGVTATNCNIKLAAELRDECEGAYALFRAIPGATTSSAYPGYASAVRVTLSDGRVLNLLTPNQTQPRVAYKICPGCSLDNIKQGAFGVVEGVAGAAESVVDGIQHSVDIVVDGVTQTIDATVNIAEHTIEIAGEVINYTVDIIRDPTLRLAACVAVAAGMTTVVSAATPLVFPKVQQQELSYLDWVYWENKLYLGQVMVPIFSLLLE